MLQKGNRVIVSIYTAVDPVYMHLKGLSHHAATHAYIVQMPIWVIINYICFTEYQLHVASHC